MPKIFNISIYPFQENELIEYCEDVLLYHNKRKIMYVNIHVLNMAYKDVILQNSLQSADRIYCDGEGVRLGAKILHEKLPIRTTGADWIYDLCELCLKNKYSIYFLGGKPSVALNAAKIMRQQYPDLLIAGAADGYFNTESEENEQRIKLINDSKADILLVGLGTPLQENWIIQNCQKIDSKILWAVGGLFGYLSGEEKRAPEIMTRNGLEWLFRFFVNPKRLFSRYVIGNPLFFVRVLKYRFSKK